MSSKVEDNTTSVEVPEASPEVNETKQEAPAAPNRKTLWIGLSLLVLVAIVVGITVPLVNKNKNKNKNKEKDDEKLITEANSLSVGTFANVDAPQCFEPKQGDTCSTKASYKECQKLASSGCKNILSTYSCPPQHQCGDLPDEGAVACTMDVAACPDGETMIGRSGPHCKFDFEKECPTAVQLPSVEDMCPPLIQGDTCSTEASHQECVKLVEEGCKLIIATASCPPMYDCATQQEAVQLPAQPDVIACQMDVRPCPDGVNSIGRSGPTCEFNFEDECPKAVQLPAQPDAIACQLDVRPCPDGVNSIGRSGPNCEFNFEDECPKAVQLPSQPDEGGECNGDKLICPSHIAVGRVAEDNCNFAPCPESLMCTLELGICPVSFGIGSFVA